MIQFKIEGIAKNQHEIAKAYKPEKTVPAIRITRPLLVNSGMIIGGMCLIFLAVKMNCMTFHSKFFFFA